MSSPQIVSIIWRFRTSRVIQSIEYSSRARWPLAVTTVKTSTYRCWTLPNDTKFLENPWTLEISWQECSKEWMIKRNLETPSYPMQTWTWQIIVMQRLRSQILEPLRNGQVDKSITKTYPLEMSLQVPKTMCSRSWELTRTAKLTSMFVLRSDFLTLA